MPTLRTLVVLVASVVVLSACGRGPAAEPVGDATPQVAWVDGRTTHVMQGDVQREIKGQWLPWLWLPNGDLLLHTPSDSSGMGVFRPASNEFVVKTDKEWGRDKYDGGEYGLDSETGAINASDVLLRIEDGDQPADLSQGPTHSLVDYDYRLKEQARVVLPPAEDAALQRDYDFPVRVGDITFIAFEDVKRGSNLDNPKNTTGGVIRVERAQVTETVRAPYVQRLFLSSDASSVLAVTSTAPPGMGVDTPDRNRKKILVLDPVSGKVLSDLGSPDGYDASTSWQVERVDRQRGQVAAQIGTDCGEGDDCVPQRTWVTDGTGWTEVGDQAGASWFWQPGDAAVSWPASGRIVWTDGTNIKKLADAEVSHRVASGSLLPPS